MDRGKEDIARTRKKGEEKKEKRKKSLGVSRRREIENSKELSLRERTLSRCLSNCYLIRP